jgi:5-methylcytosine-specific restriction protein A
MAAYLLTWNPARWPWTDLGDYIAAIERDGAIDDRWNVGSRKIAPGDRLFLMRLGKEPRGVAGAGRATSAVYWGPQWNARSRRPLAAYVDVRWERLLDPDGRGDPILRRDYLRDAFPGMFWDTQMSGIQIPDSVAGQLEVEWKRLIDALHPS